MSVCAGAGKVQHSGHTAAPELTPGRQLEPTCGACMHPLLQTHQRPGFPTWLRLQLVEGGREGGAPCHLAIKGSIQWLCIVLFGGCGVCCSVVAVGF